MKKIGLGLIGSGLCARDLHLPALLRLRDRFQVVHVASRSEAKGGDLAARTGAARHSTDYRDLLRDQEVDAVVVTYPFEMNHEITRHALDAGKHVMIEKPMAATMEQAREMTGWEESTPLVTMLAENYRYRNAINKARECLEAGLIGEPQAMTYTVLEYFAYDSVWVTESTWRLQSFGGLSLDRDVHFAAAMRYIMGDVASVTGSTSRMREDMGEADCLSLYARFKNGATGIFIDCASTIGVSKHEAVIVGTKGTIHLEDANTRLTLTSQDKPPISWEYPDDKNDSFFNEFIDFHEAICLGKPSRSGFGEGFKDLEMVMAAFRAETDK